MQEEARVEAVRRFNRFYTQRLGVLRERLLDGPFSLTEARVLYELAHGEDGSASGLVETLGLDPGYLSRILRKFQDRGSIRRAPSAADRRQNILRLTAKGRGEAERLNAAAAREIGGWMESLAETDQVRLIGAMSTVEEILRGSRSGAYVIRPQEPGDLGWIVEIHGKVYAREYGWDTSFEALVAEIVANFAKKFDARKERCWIAELGGERVGSVLIVKRSATVAKLRLLIVDGRARGMGIGARLVQEAIRFARGAGYRKLTLWTNRGLDAAKHIYEKEGFRLLSEEPHRSFGKDLVAQTWELKL